MRPAVYRALRVHETAAGTFARRIEECRLNDLPPGDLLVRVDCSSLNYKDALSATGHKGITRAYPHTPGIDAAGTVAESASDAFPVGAPVIVTGHDLGMNTAGGFAEYIRVPAAWAVPLPAGLSLFESMALGTAGFTAALAFTRMQQAGLEPGRGEVLVTGASGGVGSLAVALLAGLGYRVVAGSGKSDAGDYLRRLGAAEVLSRAELSDDSPRPLLKGRWAGVIDTVGGLILASAIRASRPGGTVASCGLTAAAEIPLTVYPFILRGVALLGVDSAECPAPLRRRLWAQLAGEWKIGGLEEIARQATLAELNDTYIERILAGGMRGRLVVRPG